MGYVTFAIAVTGVLWYWMDKENRRRDEILRETDGEVKGGNAPYSGIVAEEERIRLGDRDVHWRYTT